MIGAQIGLDFSIASRVLAGVIGWVVGVILWLTGYS
jgi:hypothetical protein